MSDETPLTLVPPRGRGPSSSFILAERRAKIAAGLRRSKTAEQIRAELGISRNTVWNDIRTLRKRYEEEARENSKYVANALVEELREQRRELWAAWERSKLQVSETTSKATLADPIAPGKAAPPSTGRVMTVKKKDNKIATDVMAQIGASIEREAKILGLIQDAKPVSDQPTAGSTFVIDNRKCIVINDAGLQDANVPWILDIPKGTRTQGAVAVEPPPELEAEFPDA